MNAWFTWYCEQTDKKKEWAVYKDRFLCPCCHMPTLIERNSFSICEICFWEDDGQDSDDAEIVRGGPNHDYSLLEARENFHKYFCMYRPGDEIPFHREQREKPKKEKLYYSYKKAMESGKEEDWQQALECERLSERGRCT